MSQRCALLTALAAAAALSTSAWAQCDQDKLAATDAESGDQFGWTVAGNRDAGTDAIFVIGAPFEDAAGGNAGAAYVFRSDGNDNWTGAKLTGLQVGPGHQFGYAVAVDGNVLAVGAPFDGGNDGAVYVFRYDQGLMVWTQEARLTASVPTTAPQFGFAIGLSGDVLAVGAPLDDTANTNAGAVYVYRFDGIDAWNEEAKLTTDGLVEGDVDEFNDRLGTSVAVSGDVVMGGAPFDDEIGSNSGGAYMFRYNGLDWTDPPQKITATNGAEFGQFGASVAVDGITAIIGAPGMNSSDGSVSIFLFGTGSWSEQESFDSPAVGDAEQFGRSVAIEADIVTIGAPFNDAVTDNAGLAYRSTYQAPNWSSLEAMTANDAAVDDNYGAAIAVSHGDVLVGAPLDDDGGQNAGSGYLIISDISGGIDCNNNGLPDDCDIDSGFADDCNANGIPDTCELADGSAEDCNANELLDVCEIDMDSSATGGPFFCAEDCLNDCNDNGVPDACEIDMDSTAPNGPFFCTVDCAADENNNGIPDDCEDCNGNGEPDDVDIAEGTSEDCNNNGIPDACEIDIDSTAPGGPFYCEADCDADINGDGIPDDCQPDCDDDGTFDVDDIATCDGSLDCRDCNDNGVPDGCDLLEATSADCNANETPDECEEMPYLRESAELTPVTLATPQTFTVLAADVEIAGEDVTIRVTTTAPVDQPAESFSVDLNGTDIGDVFADVFTDCPATDEIVLTARSFNMMVNDGDLVLTVTPTAQVEAEPACEKISHVVISVEYHFLNPPTDCNGNGTPDFCDISTGTSEDFNRDGIPDECVVDCNSNGISDLEDITKGTSEDCDANEIPDECDAPLYEQTTGLLTPISDEFPQSIVLTDPPLSGGDVEVTITARADVGHLVEVIAVRIDGALVETVFADDGNECNLESLATVMIPRETFNDAAADGLVTIALDPSSQVDTNSGFCAQTEVTLDVSFQPRVLGDCNGNGIPDGCDSRVGDATGDLLINVDDIVAVILAFDSADSDADVDGSGHVDVDDILLVILSWDNECPVE